MLNTVTSRNKHKFRITIVKDYGLYYLRVKSNIGQHITPGKPSYVDDRFFDFKSFMEFYCSYILCISFEITPSQVMDSTMTLKRGEISYEILFPYNKSITDFILKNNYTIAQFSAWFHIQLEKFNIYLQSVENEDYVIYDTISNNSLILQ